MYDQQESAARAARYVKRLGFNLPEEPSNQMPSLPADITDISEPELMRLFSEVISWLDYVEVCVASIEIDEKQEQQVLEEISAIEQIRHKAEKTVSVAKALSLQNKDFVEQRNKLLVIFGKKRLLETVYNALERKRFIISRELTRRKYGE